MAGLALGLPAERGPVVRCAGGVPATPRECRSTLMSIKTNSLFSSLGKTSVVGRILPQIGTLIYSSVRARALVRRVRAQICALSVVARSPPTVGDGIEAATPCWRAPHCLERGARLVFVSARRMVSQIVIIVGSYAGAAQVWVPKRPARLK